MRILLTILFCIGSTQALAIEFNGRTEFCPATRFEQQH